MLTRLKVSGFKNLVEVDVRFGPFTCIAGPNGVGKSNLFDAIRFISALADRPLIDAALSVRDEGKRTADIRSLFHRVGNTYTDEMSFEAEMIVPQEAYDDLGQKAKASITFLRYSLTLTYRRDENLLSFGALEIVKEELVHINRGEAGRHLLFPHTVKQWRGSAIHGQRRGGPFISTEGEGENRVIKLHQDGGSAGRPLSRSAMNLPRTVLSAANAAESPTVLVARREMQSWRLLQLEPSALRQPDEFTAPAHLGVDGSHLPATLYRLARSHNTHERNGKNHQGAAERVYSQVANRLAELIDDVQELRIESDERRELWTLYVKDRALIPILTWLLQKHGVVLPIQAEWADLRRLPRPPKTLSERIRWSIDLYPCHLLFVHRDAETSTLASRVQEIHQALERLQALQNTLNWSRELTVCVVPIRMQEAWLLLDEAAIRKASGNPNERHPLELPLIRELEQLPDPKAVLHNLLRQASELHGRRLKNFLVASRVRGVAEFISDFAPLRALTAFVALEQEIASVLKK